MADYSTGLNDLILADIFLHIQVTFSQLQLDMISPVYHRSGKIIGIFRMADISLSACGYGIIWKLVRKQGNFSIPSSL